MSDNLLFLKFSHSVNICLLQIIIFLLPTRLILIWSVLVFLLIQPSPSINPTIYDILWLKFLILGGNKVKVLLGVILKFLYKNKFISYSAGNFATFGKFNLSGPSGIAPIFKITINSNGDFQEGKIIATYQTKGGLGPKIDPNKSVIQKIIELNDKYIYKLSCFDS